ncbi:MAG: hypothetical protein Q9202_005999 [Teloschistes flavicans]
MSDIMDYDSDTEMGNTDLVGEKRAHDQAADDIGIYIARREERRSPAKGKEAPNPGERLMGVRWHRFDKKQREEVMRAAQVILPPEDLVIEDTMDLDQDDDQENREPYDRHPRDDVDSRIEITHHHNATLWTRTSVHSEAFAVVIFRLRSPMPTHRKVLNRIQQNNPSHTHLSTGSETRRAETYSYGWSLNELGNCTGLRFEHLNTIYHFFEMLDPEETSHIANEHESFEAYPAHELQQKIPSHVRHQPTTGRAH